MTLYNRCPLLRGVIVAVVALWAVGAQAQPDLILSTDESFGVGGITPGQQEAANVEFGTSTWSQPQWSTDMALPAHVSIDAIDEKDSNSVFFSLDTDVDLGGTLYADEDIIEWNGVSFSMAWDGSANGVPPGGDLNALYIADLVDLTFFASFDSDVPLESILAPGSPIIVADEDVSAFVASGFVFVSFNGSNEGVPEWADVDAVSAPSDFEFLLSFDEAVVIGSQLYDDSDLILWHISSGFTTAPWFEASAHGVPPEVNVTAADDTFSTTVLGTIAPDLSAWTYVPAIVAAGAIGSDFTGDTQANGAVQTDDDGDGSGSDLNMTIGTAAGDSYQFFQSPLSAIPFVDGATYRTQWAVSSTTTDPAAGPQLRTRFVYGAFGNMGNGNQVVSGVVSLPGTGTTYLHLLDQLDVASANASIPVGTDTTAENDMLLFFEMIDLGNPAAAGDLELDDLLIERLDRSTLRTAEQVETTVANFSTTNTVAGIAFGNTPITVSTTTGNATITAPVSNGGAGVTVFGDLPLNLLEDGIAINPFTPANTNGYIYRAQVTLNASSNSIATPLPLATLRLQTFSSALQSPLYAVETQLNSLRFGSTALNPNYDGAGETLSALLQVPAGVALDGTDPDGVGPGIGFGDQLVSTIQLQDGSDAEGGAIVVSDYTVYRFPEALLP